MSPLLMPAEDGGWLVLSLAFALGACIGSFLNVCIYRLPQDESVLRPASRCPGCGTPIAWRDNIPLLSWFLLGARCRACRASIPARYPLVEAATGALAVLALVALGPTPSAAVAFLFTGRGRRRMRRVARRLGAGAVLPFVRRAARRTEIPFGPFLALGAVLALYHPSVTLPWRLG